MMRCPGWISSVSMPVCTFHRLSDKRLITWSRVGICKSSTLTHYTFQTKNVKKTIEDGFILPN